MAVKSNFAAGDVLTASNVNTYLTNGGLVYITQATASAGSASLVIDGCFTSTYADYRIVTRFGSATSGFPGVLFYMRAGGVDNTSANYYYAGNGRSAASVDFSYGAAATTSGYLGGLSGHFVSDIINPASSTTQTLLTGQAMFYDGTNFINRTTGNWHNVASAFDGIKFFPASSTFTANFTVQVYGYRQA